MGYKHVEKKCGDCQQYKPVEEFYPSKCGTRGRDGYCKTCRRIRDRNRKDIRNQVVLRLKAKDPLYFRRKKLLKLYGITDADYQRMFAEQDGACAICGSKETRVVYDSEPPRLVVDHNHITGKVRGLLCHQCNTRLSVVEDEQFTLLARQYIRERDGYEFIQENDKQPSEQYIAAAQDARNWILENHQT